MRDAEATRSRILDAATAEFAEYGIAGARVDRIATRAEANKALIYTYFGNKDALFDVVFEAHVVANVDQVPPRADDLPGYAVALYDAYLADPALVRLITWKRLERTPTGNVFGGLARGDAAKIAAIEQAQRDGLLVDAIAPLDLWAMFIALAGSWAQAAIIHAASRRERRVDHDRRRAALAVTVRRAFCVDRG